MSLASLRLLIARYGRWILLGFGILALALLLRSAGVGRVLDVLASAGHLLPAILALEGGWAVCEGMGFLLLLGPRARKLPVRVWLQGTLAHYVTMTTLPVGRAGAEVLRAALFGPFVGKAEAASSAALLHSGSLLANSLVSAGCAAFALDRKAPVLAWFLVGNAVATLALSLVIYLGLARAHKLTRFRLLARFASFGEDVLTAFRGSRPRQASAFALITLARLVQTVQYGVILFAVAGAFSLQGTFIAHGIHLVGAGLGDMVPNQVGVQEGAYRGFAGALDFGSAPEKALAVALLARFATLSVAAACALLLQLFRANTTKPSAEIASNPG